MRKHPRNLLPTKRRRDVPATAVDREGMGRGEVCEDRVGLRRVLPI